MVFLKRGQRAMVTVRASHGDAANSDGAAVAQ
jgi:hypothetical protein